MVEAAEHESLRGHADTDREWSRRVISAPFSNWRDPVAMRLSCPMARERWEGSEDGDLRNQRKDEFRA